MVRKAGSAYVFHSCINNRWVVNGFVYEKGSCRVRYRG